MKALIRPAVKSAARLSLVRRGLIAYHDRRLTAGDWARPHPFDREHGIETSGCVPGYLIQADVSNYSGSQPSIVRRALEQIPGPERYALVDLGCGKGRVLAVASELPFRRVVGVELSPILAKAARRNATVLARRYPARTRIEVAVADAATFRLPDGPVVVFLFNPFGEETTRRLVAHVEADLAREDRDLYLVAYNPAWGEVFDASPHLRRWYADLIPYAESELGFGTDTSDTVVIWRNASRPDPAPSPGADRALVVTIPGWRATLVPEPPLPRG